MRLILLAAALLGSFFVPGAGATSGDAGTEIDAGMYMEDAIPVPLGTFEGSLPFRDYGDAYRFEVPAGTGVRFVVTPLEGEIAIQTLRSDGSSGFAWAGGSTGPLEVRGVAYDGVIGLSVWFQGPSWPAAYRVEASTMPRYDIAILSMEATPIDALGIQRNVRVVVENQGAGYNGFSDEWLSVFAVHADGAVRYVGNLDWGSSLQIAPGTTREYSLTWDTLGEVGDVQLVAESSHPHDEDLSDNILAIAQTVLVEGEGRDLLNQRQEVSVADARVIVEWWSTPWVTPAVPFVFGEAEARSDLAYCRTDNLGFGCGFPGLEPVFWAVVDALP